MRDKTIEELKELIQEASDELAERSKEEYIPSLSIKECVILTGDNIVIGLKGLNLPPFGPITIENNLQINCILSGVTNKDKMVTRFVTFKPTRSMEEIFECK